jgi:hypothetical protein
MTAGVLPIRWIKRRDDPRNGKRPPDPPSIWWSITTCPGILKELSSASDDATEIRSLDNAPR